MRVKNVVDRPDVLVCQAVGVELDAELRRPVTVDQDASHRRRERGRLSDAAGQRPAMATFIDGGDRRRRRVVGEFVRCGLAHQRHRTGLLLTPHVRDSAVAFGQCVPTDCWRSSCCCRRRSDDRGAALAEELEVSVRTIYRDIEALSIAGVPVFSEPGPGGGCELCPATAHRSTR